MDSTLFAAYVPAFNAYLNGDLDTKAKTWSDVVELFFKMNVDEKLSSMTDFAQMFNHSAKPDLLMINPLTINSYLENYIETKKTLMDEGFIEDVDFIEHDEGLRISFSTFRRLIFRHGDENLVLAYEFVDKVFQMFLRYRMKMITRGKLPTHWTIVERVDKFSSVMKPHAPKNGKPLMNKQPRVFYIVKGQAKQIHTKFRSYKKDPTKGYLDEPLMPIYETVLDDANDEIKIVLQYLEKQHSLPYRMQYIEEHPGESLTPSTALHCIKVHKSFVLIDPSQDTYTPAMLPQHVAEIRVHLKTGRDPLAQFTKSSKKDKEPNFTDIKIFEASHGKYIDDRNLYDLNPHFDDIAVVDTSKIDTSFIPQTTPIAAESDVDQSDAESVMSRMTEIKPRKRTTSRDSTSKAKGRARTSTQDTVLTEEDEVPSILPRAKGRGRTNTLTSIPDESPLMDIITGGKYESEESDHE